LTFPVQSARSLRLLLGYRHQKQDDFFRTVCVEVSSL